MKQKDNYVNCFEHGFRFEISWSKVLSPFQPFFWDLNLNIRNCKHVGVFSNLNNFFQELSTKKRKKSLTSAHQTTLSWTGEWMKWFNNLKINFILDRIAEKDSTDNLFRAGSESRSEAGTAGTSAAALAESADIRQVNNSLQVFIDGPFGAPTNLIFHAQHAVLIGTGIGVTPFASILQSIMHRWVNCVIFNLWGNSLSNNFNILSNHDCNSNKNPICSKK